MPEQRLVKTSTLILILLGLIILGSIVAAFMPVGQKAKEETDEEVEQITSFMECLAAGNPVMESYPRQCNTQDGAHFVEEIGNELEKTDLIQIASPRPNQTVTSPIIITGQARGTWYFEASFPITLTDWDGRIIAESYATAQGDWMTEEFVPFKAELPFDVNEVAGGYSNKGYLILRKDNASGLPEHDDSLEIPIYLE